MCLIAHEFIQARLRMSCVKFWLSCKMTKITYDYFKYCTNPAKCPYVRYKTRGALLFEVGFHPRKRIHVIGVVFQDQAMYVRTSFRGAKSCKNWGKWCFLVIFRILVPHWGKKLRKKEEKNMQKRDTKIEDLLVTKKFLNQTWRLIGPRQGVWYK